VQANLPCVGQASLQVKNIVTSLCERRKENQLDATEWFIALIICSTCFGHLYTHHQELETILVLLPHMVCNQPHCVFGFGGDTCYVCLTKVRTG